MKPLSSIFKIIKEDFISDVVTIQRMIKEPEFVKQRLDDIRKDISNQKLDKFLMHLLSQLIIWGAFFFAGWFLASRYYQGMCNQYIYDTFLDPLRDKPFIDSGLKLINESLIQ